jgi:hypothetical protein
MRLSGRAVLLAGAVAASFAVRPALAQEGIVRAPPPQAQVSLSGADQAGTLDVPPRFGSSPPAAPAPSIVPPAASNSSAEVPNSPESSPADADAASPELPEVKLPYLGIGVQYIVSDNTPGREVRATHAGTRGPRPRSGRRRPGKPCRARWFARSRTDDQFGGQRCHRRRADGAA